MGMPDAVNAGATSQEAGCDQKPDDFMGGRAHLSGQFRYWMGCGPVARLSRIDADAIAELVVAFYAKARQDALLGPVFLAAIGPEDEAWIPHIQRVCAFWESVMLATGRYLGRPMQAHAALSGLGSNHFARWLELFGETAREIFAEREALAFTLRAEKMAAALQHGIAAASAEERQPATYNLV